MAEAIFPRNPFHGQKFTLPGSGGEYYYDKTRYSWIFTAVTGMSGGGDGGNVSISDAPPYPAESGDLWIQTPTYFLYAFDAEASLTGRWIGLTNNGGDNTAVHVGPKPPEGANQKHTFWFDSNSGDLRILYADDGKTVGIAGQPAPASTQWVTITSNGQSIGTSSYIIAQLETQVNELEDRLADLQSQIDEGNQGFAIELG